MSFWILHSILVLSCSFCVGWFGSAAYNRAQRRRILELEYVVEDLAGRVLRETKIRAAEKSLESRRTSDELVDWAKKQSSPPQLPLGDWIKSRMLQK